MSKKYKGKTCVYCSEKLSDTGDHIFAREFFLVNERAKPLKVPACNACNNRKSRLEHYLTSVLPFGGKHSQAKENLGTMVPKRLKQNMKLHNELRDGLNRNNEKGRMSIPLEGSALNELFRYIAKGLTWLHWDTIIERDTFVLATALTIAGERLLYEKFISISSKYIENSVGKDSFLYLGAQAIDNDQITAWLFKIYAGIEMSGASDIEDEHSESIGVITCPWHLKEKVISVFGES